jgi:hypothetical protein
MLFSPSSVWQSFLLGAAYRDLANALCHAQVRVWIESHGSASNGKNRCQ